MNTGPTIPRIAIRIESSMTNSKPIAKQPSLAWNLCSKPLGSPSHLEHVFEREHQSQRTICHYSGKREVSMRLGMQDLFSAIRYSFIRPSPPTNSRFIGNPTHCRDFI